ncbi:DUF4185 domain-containing protein [Streptomyces abikoensis]|uniref:DUF4185 domain-containing protein n=1 Tax=Streptomyces abikoensis TaxID=97398 RepID=UPI001674AD1A|nr:DUF4185 domain-containing protein [Streptomyces abikoensis]GGP47284.1 hypothetical protein GCM10010214_20570 [Streptomyces abikoensis]
MHDSTPDSAPRPPQTPIRPVHLSRAGFLRAAATAALAGGPLLRAPAHAAAGPLRVFKVADLTGPGLTARFRMEATDLGVPVRTPDDRLLFVFGDTFEEARAGGGWWRSPVALYGRLDGPGRPVVWTGAVGGRHARQLWPYDHDNLEYSTVLPSDGITLGGTMYLHVMMNKGRIGNVVRTEIWRSDDSGATWSPTGAVFAPNLHDGKFQLLTWALGDDGYVYVLSTGFQRDKPVILHRVRPDRLTDPGAYEPWGQGPDSRCAWGNPPTPVLDGTFGELCLRLLDGQWILTWFNQGDYRIEGLVADHPTADLRTAHRRTLLWGTSWGNEDDTHVAQLYGGYVIPGSTLDDLHLSVSQWNTKAGWPYRVMQFRVRGLAF